ncbi:cysteine--tRNA ligase [Candidatus Micrarchaeota archaeon CG1_02_47_40]|nr:MAG: cysteine--tRNA ligase [Candidatus Micrarchaeota archaeon CG1_02_47_40]
MRIHNTLTGKKEEFKPLREGQVSMYVCGVTTYDYSHLGHARTYVSFDVIRRYLLYSGYDVKFIQNVTDVDDKIINRAKEAKQEPLSLSTKFDMLSREDFASLSILPASLYPKVTENIPKIISLVQKLLQKGFAYETKTGIYFDVAKFPSYGKLSHQNMQKIKSGARIEVDEKKKNPADFALWKLVPPDELGFPSPFGRGRPGWHIECSAMALNYAGETLDMHGGARDLIFPHHENEIAQSESATGKKFVNYWVHTGFLTVNGEKMAKSLGNFITIRVALKKFDANAIRFFFIQTHYRSPIDFSEEAILSAGRTLDGVFGTLQRARETAQTSANKEEDSEFEEKIEKTFSSLLLRMDDDFDTPNALASFFEMISLTNSHLSSPRPSSPTLSHAVRKLETILEIFAISEEKKELPLGKLQKILVELGEKKPPSSAEDCMKKIIQMRDTARKKKDYAASDKIRAMLAKEGITLEDEGGKTTYK